MSHQANRRIIEAAAERLGPARRKVVINLERFGNTTGATIPLALADAVAEKRLKRGDLVLLASVGAGFTVGAVLLRWGYCRNFRPQAEEPVAVARSVDSISSTSS